MKLTFFYVVVLAAIVATVHAYPSKRDNDDDDDVIEECPSDDGCCDPPEIPEEHRHAYSPKLPKYASTSIVTVGSPLAYILYCHIDQWIELKLPSQTAQ